jgi:hypothetical protein
MIFASLVAAAFLAIPSRANQIRLGEISPASPANFDQELGFVNTLVDLANGLTLAESSHDLPDRTYTLTTDPLAILPPPSATNPDDVENWSKGVSFPIGSGYSYLLAKYGNTAVVFLSDDGAFTIGDHVDGIRQSISHYTAFRSENVSVADGGSTMILMGIGLAALGMFQIKRA